MATSVTPLADINKAVPFRGGCNTAVEPDLLPFGAYSMVQNFRGLHPGMEKRKGCIKQHTEADGSLEVVTLFQFAKGKVTESHLYAQMGDGDVLDATSEPPAVTTGAFGAEVFSGSSGQIPASWSVINDMVLYSNGVDQHQINIGDEALISQVVVYKGDGAIPNIPTIGEDYTEQATDGLDTTVVCFSDLDTLANYHCIFIRTTLPATSLRFVISSANGDAAVLAGKYWNGAWTALPSFTDGTADGGAAFAQNGSASWTQPTDEIPHYLFNESGFWYQLYLSSGKIDAKTEISAIYYSTGWQALQNVWDGFPIDITEAMVYDDSLGSYSTYGAVNIDLSLAETADRLNFACATNICGFYVDVGSTPNTTTTTTISAVKFWNGTELESVSGLNDGSSGFSKSGWVTFTRPTTGQPRQFRDTGYYAHWFEVTFDKGLSSSVKISIQVMPFFDIAEFGSRGLVNIAWKDRALYVWDRFPVDICVSAKSRPLTLNGSDFCYLERPGDGRLNKIVAWKKFYNDLMVWQEELGTNGGCLTIYEGYSPDTFGKFVVSTRYGTFNAKSAIVVEGVRLGENKVEDRPICIAFFLSHTGVCMSDGRSVVVISQDIQNYFDPTKEECIRNGYEDKMWIAHDATYNVLRIGLVSGDTATTCNVFPIYDLTDRCWYFDSLAQPFACVADIQAGSGDVTVLQVAGGCADGQVYQTNRSNDDVDQAIDAYITMELDGSGALLDFRELIVRTKSGQGNLVVTPIVDGVEQNAKTIP